VLRESLEGAHLFPELELVDFVSVSVARLRVLDDDLEGREAGAPVVIEVFNGFQIPVGVEEGADVGEGDAGDTPGGRGRPSGRCARELESL